MKEPRGYIWPVLVTPEFEEWFATLGQADRRGLDVKIRVLEQLGPRLGRPHADTVDGSRHANMKELRARGTLRAFYAFDPWRRAILLTGGDKRNDRWFYTHGVARADELFDRHLMSLDSNGSREKPG